MSLLVVLLHSFISVLSVVILSEKMSRINKNFIFIGRFVFMDIILSVIILIIHNNSIRAVIKFCITEFDKFKLPDYPSIFFSLLLHSSQPIIILLGKISRSSNEAVVYYIIDIIPVKISFAIRLPRRIKWLINNRSILRYQLPLCFRLPFSRFIFNVAQFCLGYRDHVKPSAIPRVVEKVKKEECKFF